MEASGKIVLDQSVFHMAIYKLWWTDRSDRFKVLSGPLAALLAMVVNTAMPDLWVVRAIGHTAGTPWCRRRPPASHRWGDDAVCPVASPCSGPVIFVPLMSSNVTSQVARCITAKGGPDDPQTSTRLVNYAD